MKKKSNKSDTIKKRIERQQEEWMEAFKNNWTISGACLKIGITRTTYYDWAKKYPEFLQRKKEIEREQIEFVESKLYKAIKEEDLTAIIFYLKCKSKKWRPYEKREISGAIKTKIDEGEKLGKLLKNADKETREQFNKAFEKLFGSRGEDGKKSN